MRKLVTFLVAILITVSANVSAQKINHPSLLFTPERVAAAKKAVQNDTVMQRAWESIKSEADNQLEGRWDIMKLEHLALAYQMTGDKKYAEKLKDILLEVAKTKSWGNGEMLARTPAWRS